MTDVIILHGAWHQPAHYDELATLLRSQGLRVVVPDLYRLSLPDSTAAVESIIAASERPPLVIGHSFGGVTAGTVRGAAGLIFLTSWILDVGESPAQLLDDVEQATGAPAEGLIGTPDSNGQIRLDPDDARKRLYGDVDEPEATRAVELLRPGPLAIFRSTPSRVSWPETPSVYIAGRGDHTIAPPLVDRFAQRCSTVEIWQTSHSPYLSQPAAVADLVHRQAQVTRSSYTL